MTDTTRAIRCGNCGQANPPGTQVCARCGAPLAAYQSLARSVSDISQSTNGGEAEIPASVDADAGAPTEASGEPAPGAASSSRSPIGDALARIKERAAQEQATRDRAAENPSPATPSESSFTFAAPAAPPSEPPRKPPVARQPAAPSPTAARVPIAPQNSDNGKSAPVAKPVASAPQQPVVRPEAEPATGRKARQAAVTSPMGREQRRSEPVLATPQRRQPDRLARASSASLMTWGVGLVAFAFVLGIALPGASHAALGEVIVTLATLVGIVLFVVGLARKSGARRPADRRPRRRR